MSRPISSLVTRAVWCCWYVAMGGFAATTTQAAESTSLAESLVAIQRIGAEGQGHAEAMKAWPVVVQASADQLPQILASMRDENRLANNWVRGAVDAIAQRTIEAGGALPVQELDAYLGDTTHSARSRRLAYEWLLRVDSEAATRWLPKLLNDPSLELRRDAVGAQLDKAQAALSAGDKEAALAGFRESLSYARDKDQVEAAAKALRDLGETVDLARHFGFVMKWHLIGPFDNRNTIGFDQVYEPEKEIKLDAEYPGLEQLARWQLATTTHEYGELNLNELIGRHKGAVAYAVSYFEADSARPVELRLGCINANKVWLNGQLLTANHVYHAGDSLDQYIGRGELKEGRNVILVKICQNEQTEEWAQDWKFQLRVCDALGTAILPKNDSEH